jgi:4-hydroxy 2-oxovalerate aldolase
MSHQFTAQQVRDVAQALDEAGVPVIECNHGDGLAGSSIQYGFSKEPEMNLISEAASVCEQAKIAALLLPGVGTVEQLKEAVERGIGVLRIATHCTEADIAIQHFEAARALGMETVGFLMLSHRIEGPALARQARIMADAGCQCVYVVDSAGWLMPQDVTSRVSALVAELGPDTQVGFHGHQNLSLGAANSLAAYEAGARQIDGTLCALGAGAGNTPTEILAALFERLGVHTGLDVDLVLHAAWDVLRPLVTRLPIADRSAIEQGRFGVYSSFLLHAERAGAQYGVPAHQILRAAGEAGYVGGQEDMIIDIAVQLAAKSVA